jgi:hypothetical protein
MVHARECVGESRCAAVRSALDAEGWARARAAVEDGASFREVAEELGVAHTTLSRAAARAGWTVPVPPWEVGDAADADLHVTEPQGEQEPVDEPARLQIEPQGPRSEREAGAREREAWEPPEDEQSARLWHCRRCGLSGFDANRGPARAWHSQEVCDVRLARLDAALDDSPRPLDVMRCPW